MELGMENLGLFHPENPTGFVPEPDVAGQEGLTELTLLNPTPFRAAGLSEDKQFLTQNLDRTETPSISEVVLVSPGQDLGLTLTQAQFPAPGTNLDLLTGRAEGPPSLVATRSPGLAGRIDPLTGLAVQATLTGLNKATQAAYSALSALATDQGFTAKATLAFGSLFNTEKLEDLHQEWAASNFAGLPAIELRSNKELEGADGAFSRDTNTIYLSQEYSAQNVSNPLAITKVLLEEIGHSIDSQINLSDAAGDEGAIFSALVRGVKLAEPALQTLKVEDDTATITLDGQVIQVEQAAGYSINDTNYAVPSSARFISPSGNNSNRGTQASPWRTLEKALNSAPSGSTIVLRGGTYHEGDLRLTKKLTLQPYQQERVWLDGGQRFERSLTMGGNSAYSVIRGLGFRQYKEEGLYVGEQSSHTTLQNNIFTENADSGLGIQETSAIVRDNTFSNNGHRGLWAVRADRTLVEDNLITGNNVGRFDTSWAAAGAKFINTDSLILRDNLVEDNYSNGLWVDVLSHNTTIVRNTARNNQLNGIFFEASQDAIIASNLSVDNGRHGITVQESKGAKVWNNTLSRNAVNLAVRDGKRDYPWSVTNNVIMNNIFSNVTGSAPGGTPFLTDIVNFDSGSRNQLVTAMDYNAYYRTSLINPLNAIRSNSPENGNSTYQSVANFRVATRFEDHALAIDNVVTNPFFVNGSYQLKSGSSAIERGQQLPVDIARAIGVADGVKVNLGVLRLG